MERIDIWYLTDNDAGKGVAASLHAIGITTHLLVQNTVSFPRFDEHAVNLFIFDFQVISADLLLDGIRSDSRIQNAQKIAILPFDSIERTAIAGRDILHLDFISRPYNKRELLLFLEKSAVVEKYREIMRSISKEAEGRIEAFESLMHIHQSEILENEDEKAVFEKIVSFERRLMDEQKKLNEAIKEFTVMRQKELFNIRNRLQAEELLDALRRKEMFDAHDTIRAQQAVLEFSAKEISEANRIIQASQITGELSREEALCLHNELRTLRDRVAELELENAAFREKAGK